MADPLAKTPITSHLWQSYLQRAESTDLPDTRSVTSPIDNSLQVSEWNTTHRELTATSVSPLSLHSGSLIKSRPAWTPEPPVKTNPSSRFTLVHKSGKQICQMRSCTAALALILCLLSLLAIALPVGLIYGLTTTTSTSTPTTVSSTSVTSIGTTIATTATMITSTTTTISSSSSTSTTSTATTTTSTSTTSTTSPQTAWIPSNYNQSCSGTFTNVTTVTPSTLLGSWPLEQTANDISGNGCDGQTVNGPIYTTGYIGQGLLLQSNLSQYVSGCHVDLLNRSFTVEAWIYLNSLSPTGDLDIFGECESSPSPDRCLHYVIRQSRLYLGFHGDDLYGATNLTIHVWYHAAFVYDLSVNMKAVYLNGILNGNKTTGNPYQGQSGNITIGSTAVGTASSYWNGILDQLTISNRAKTAFEILNDASLIIHLPFDTSFNDIGPNSLSVTYNLQGNNGLSWVTGRVNQALSFNASISYVESCGILPLGLNQAYSMAMWVNPSFQGGTLLHIASASGGSGAWCLPMIGFTSNGSLVVQAWNGAVVSVVGSILPVNAWTHIVKTWSPTNGLRLYINGGLFNSAVISSFSSSNLRMCILLGTSGLGTNCQTSQIVMGSYSGAIDEVYVYSRELTAAEVCPLAHP